MNNVVFTLLLFIQKTNLSCLNYFYLVFESVDVINNNGIYLMDVFNESINSLNIRYKSKLIIFFIFIYIEIYFSSNHLSDFYFVLKAGHFPFKMENHLYFSYFKKIYNNSYITNYFHIFNEMFRLFLLTCCPMAALIVRTSR